MSDDISVKTTTDIKVADPEQQFVVSDHRYKDVFCTLMIGFSCIIIGYIVLYGNDHNSLHESALSWAFLTVLSILAGYGLGSLTGILPNVSSMFNSRK